MPKLEIVTECRRCDGCPTSEHHWLEGEYPFFFICKHCLAVAVPFDSSGDCAKQVDGCINCPDFNPETQSCGKPPKTIGWFVPLDVDASDWLNELQKVATQMTREERIAFTERLK